MARFDTQGSTQTGAHIHANLRTYRPPLTHKRVRVFVCGLCPCLWAHMHACVCLQHKQIGSVSVYSSCWVELRSLRRMLWLASPFLCFINCLSGTLAVRPGQRRFILDSRRKRSVWRKRQCFLTISRCLLNVIIFSSTSFAFLQKIRSLCQPPLKIWKWQDNESPAPGGCF